MKKVFISGTAGFGTTAITELPPQVISLLDEIIYNGDMVLVGDCHGVDTLVQAYLKATEYPKVIVFCSGRSCRNKLNRDWEEVHVAVPYGVRGREFYAAKDLVMADRADLGIAIWDGRSVGTGNNVTNLQNMNKPVTIFRTDLNKFESR